MNVNRRFWRPWLALGCGLAWIIAAACEDAATSPKASPITLAPAIARHTTRPGSAHPLTIELTPDPVYSGAQYPVPASERYTHPSWVRAAVEGTVSRHTNYDWLWTDTSWNAAERMVTIGRGDFAAITIDSGGTDIYLYPYGGGLAPASAGLQELGQPYSDFFNYAPPGHPHVLCGAHEEHLCVTYDGSVTVTLTPYEADLTTSLDANMYLPGSTAKLTVAVDNPNQNGHTMVYEEDSIVYQPDDSGETASGDHNWGGCLAPTGCTHLVRGGANWKVTGWVNGIYREKTVQVNVSRPS